MVSVNGPRPNGSSLPNGGANGAANGGAIGGAKPSKRAMMHIDDAVRITVDFDPYWPIDKILNHAEECLKRAESFKAFNRIDLALKEYMKAYITTVEVLPRNKGWTSLISDKKGSKAKYNSIMARVEEQRDTFERIKQAIKEDNARTGVQPQAAQRRPASEDSEPSADQPKAHVNGSRPPSTQSPHKAKPAVQPKPRALHGNAIAKQPVAKAGGPSKTPEDLAARFANLRGGHNSKDNDSAESLSLAHMMPTLPAMPAAIYSPARGTVSSHAAELPTSNQRGMFSRSNSIASVTKSPPIGGDYFPPMQSYTAPTESANRARSALPAGDSVTVQELLGLMQSGSRDVQSLIIDVRDRQDFDEGHILSQSTICIEPDILQRENISAAQIVESMILAPQTEVRLFERRHEFDLVIICDQTSDTMPTRPKHPEEKAILALYNALSLYDYDAAHGSEPKKPKLLKGGIDAWTNVVGPNSLQTSSTAGNVASKPPQTATLRPPTSRVPGKRRISTIQDADEARSWENHVRSENSVLVRTTEDFLRRFPPVSAIQESMTSPVERPQHKALPAVARVDYSTDFPSPPTRPAPTVPRYSHSGLPDDMDSDPRARAMSTVARGSSRTQRKRTGLVNPSQWCYANSMLQAMFGSGAFAEEYITDSWSETWKVPMKQGEKIQNPQLLSKILANLFHWMQNGTFESMKAKTLMEYVGHIHQKDSTGVTRSRQNAFGGTQQQDSQEFLLFVMDILHDETNRKRDKDGKRLEANVTLPMHSTTDKMLAKAKDHWASYSLYNDSIIDKYWRSQTATRRICSCGHSSMTFATYETYVLPLPQDQRRETSLTSLLERESAEELLEGYKCDSCNQAGTTKQKMEFGRLPDRLCFVLSRFSQMGDRISKNDLVVNYPTSDLDMGKYALQGTSGQDSQAQAEGGFRGPFVYDLYASIVQSGSMSGGHYRAYVQDDPTRVKSTEWTLYNDSRLTSAQIGGSGDQTRDLYQDRQGATAYILFYQRRGTK